MALSIASLAWAVEGAATLVEFPMAAVTYDVYSLEAMVAGESLGQPVKDLGGE